MTPQTCNRCKTAPIFLAYVEDRGKDFHGRERGGGWVAFETAPDYEVGHWIMHPRGADTFTAEDLSTDSLRLQQARRDAYALYVPHQLRCPANPAVR